jgi:hypothetical protein
MLLPVTILFITFSQQAEFGEEGLGPMKPAGLLVTAGGQTLLAVDSRTGSGRLLLLDRRGALLQETHIPSDLRLKPVSVIRFETVSAISPQIQDDLTSPCLVSDCDVHARLPHNSLTTCLMLSYTPLAWFSRASCVPG